MFSWYRITDTRAVYRAGCGSDAPRASRIARAAGTVLYTVADRYIRGHRRGRPDLVPPVACTHRVDSVSTDGRRLTRPLAHSSGPSHSRENPNEVLCGAHAPRPRRRPPARVAAATLRPTLPPRAPRGPPVRSPPRRRAGCGRRARLRAGIVGVAVGTVPRRPRPNARRRRRGARAARRGRGAVE